MDALGSASIALGTGAGSLGLESVLFLKMYRISGARQRAFTLEHVQAFDLIHGT